MECNIHIEDDCFTIKTSNGLGLYGFTGKFYFASIDCKLYVNEYDMGISFDKTISDIHFEDNGIKINEIILDNLKIENVTLLELDDEICDEFHINKSDIETCIRVFFPIHKCLNFVVSFIKNYKGYCCLPLIRCNENDDNLFKNISNDLFYYSGSMINEKRNLNHVWRKNLFILISSLMFQNQNKFQDEDESRNENEFQSDLLMNPIVLMKLADYLNQI